jgi:hypothetical protein
MPTAKQLSVCCENRPGGLSHVARILGDAKVSILAFHCRSEGQQGFIDLILDNSNKGKKALTAAGLDYTEADVLFQELPNMPGALGYFAGKIAQKQININTGWGTTLQGSKKGAVVLGVSDAQKIARLR